MSKSSVTPVKANVFSRMITFIRQVIGELKKVVAPTRKELLRYTLVVLVFVVVMIAIASVLDLAFGSASSFIFGGTSGDN